MNSTKVQNLRRNSYAGLTFNSSYAHTYTLPLCIYWTAIEALRSRLDPGPGSKTIAAQDFRHSIQRSGESVPDYIRCLEKTYQIAYGKDNLNSATRDALLYGQLYEGLSYDLMQSPAVSGAQQ